MPEIGSSLGKAIKGFKEASEKREPDEAESKGRPDGEPPKICPQCGRELSTEGAFCPACGKKLSEKG